MSDVVKTSMLYWYPIIKRAGVLTPKTVIVEVPFDNLIGLLDGNALPERYTKQVIEAGEEIGYPLFLRTDMGSAKHSWERTCYVPERGELLKHVWSLIDETLAMGMFGELDPNALVLREMLYLDSAFEAFNGLPISRERRYFIKDGEVICHHPYWIEDAVDCGWGVSKPSNWRSTLQELNTESKGEVRYLTTVSRQVAKALTGFWSVDYAMVPGVSWYLVDMAEGEKSWHPEHKEGV